MNTIRVLQTPTGPFFILRHEDGAVETGWLEMADAMGPRSQKELAQARRDDSIEENLAQRLRAAFDGDLVDFDDIETPPGTPFQRACWRSTRAIPYGETRSYKELADMAGHPGAARAVGQAMRQNPLPIVVPCHRVVATSGLGGFGGQDTPGCRTSIKGHLLSVEGNQHIPALNRAERL